MHIVPTIIIRETIVPSFFKKMPIYLFNEIFTNVKSNFNFFIVVELFYKIFSLPVD